MCLMTEQEAADYAKISRDTIRRLVKAGRLESVDLGTGGRRRTLRIPCEALMRVKNPPAAPAPELPRRRRRRSYPAPAPVW